MTLAYDTAGDGPDVLLVHSTATDRRMWDPQIPALVATGYRAVRCDLRGFGDSPPGDRPYDDAGDVLEVLDRLGIGRTAVVGSSGGGAVALEVAARRPERVSALVLLCAMRAGHRPGSRLREFGAREDALLEAGDVDAATRLNVDLWMGPQGGAEARRSMYEMQYHAFTLQAGAPQVASGDVHTDPASVTARTLLVSGDHDVEDFRQIAAELATTIAGARHVELDWAGHLPSMERPDLLNPLLLDFLNG